ncbi:DEAD/DEAH box helicase [Cohnella algarum]|uniref:DEAD/DEAH box helicase n=1 Tax=Cohnella algarum TaxID=2044859 RepID=UPI0030840FC6
MTSFAKLGISEERSAVLNVQGIKQPTPIQEMAIPVVMQGKDMIGQAQTGTGKTLAFVLPILEKIDVGSESLQGLIVTPTRELALQITEEVKRFLVPDEGVRVLAVYGGQDVEAQMKKLAGRVHLIIATPGRLLDHMRRETVDLSTVSTLVLDEADQMLHMGFLTEVEDILRAVPARRQTLLFSATMPEKIRELAGRILRNPEHVTVKSPKVTVKDIKQLVVETTDRGKQAALVAMLEETQPFLGMIFCRTKRRASTLNAALQAMGYASDELHGDLSQAKREQVMKRFREAKLQLLVATDIAARGLDVEGVTHVYNYDIPHDTESYIHRIGRTGRAGSAGMAITFVAPKDRAELGVIEYGIGQELERRAGVPTPRGARADGAEAGAGAGEREPRARGGRFAGAGGGAGAPGSAGRRTGAAAGGGERGGRSAGPGGRAGRGERSGAFGGGAGRGGASGASGRPPGGRGFGARSGDGGNAPGAWGSRAGGQAGRGAGAGGRTGRGAGPAGRPGREAGPGGRGGRPPKPAFSSAGRKGPGGGGKPKPQRGRR